MREMKDGSATRRSRGRRKEIRKRSRVQTRRKRSPKSAARTKLTLPADRLADLMNLFIRADQPVVFVDRLIDHSLRAASRQYLRPATSSANRHVIVRRFVFEDNGSHDPPKM